MFHKPESTPIDTLDPAEVAEIIDGLAARIHRDGNADLLGPWAVVWLASKLGLTVALSVSDDPSEGLDWHTMCQFRSSARGRAGCEETGKCGQPQVVRTAAGRQGGPRWRPGRWCS